MIQESSAEITPKATASGRGAWQRPLLLFLVVFCVYAVTAARSSISDDAHAAAVESWRVASSGNPWLEQVLGTKTPNDQWLAQAPNGHVVAQRMAGPVIAGIPFYFLLNNSENPADFVLVVGGVAAAALTALSVMLMFLALHPRVSKNMATGAALVFAFATPTWSVSANGLWTHTITQLGIAGALYAASRSRWLPAGLFLAAGMLGRPHLAIIAAVFGLGMAWSRRDRSIAVAIALPTAGSLAVLVLWNHWMFGGWTLGGAYEDNRAVAAVTGASSSQWNNILGFLVSFDRGLVIWTPLLLVLLPAVVRSWGVLPDWSKWMVPAGLLYTVFQLRLNYFAGGDTFYGYRHGLELLTCLVPALTFSVGKTGGLGRWLIAPVVALQLATISVGATSESFFIPLADVWTDNGFWFALRTQPWRGGLMLAGFVIIGIAESLIIHRRLQRMDQSVPTRPFDEDGDPTSCSSGRAARRIATTAE